MVSCALILSQVYPKLLSHPLAVIVERNRCGRDYQRKEPENRNSPSIAQFIEDRRRKKRDDAPNKTAKDRASSNGGSGIFLERVNAADGQHCWTGRASPAHSLIVLSTVQDHDLSDAVEERRDDGHNPMGVVLHSPSKPVVGLSQSRVCSNDPRARVLTRRVRRERIPPQYLPKAGETPASPFRHDVWKEHCRRYRSAARGTRQQTGSRGRARGTTDRLVQY